LREIIVSLIGLDPFLNRLASLRDAAAVRAPADLAAVRPSTTPRTHTHMHIHTCAHVNAGMS
jgi:hypothetical protein